MSGLVVEPVSGDSNLVPDLLRLIACCSGLKRIVRPVECALLFRSGDCDQCLVARFHLEDTKATQLNAVPTLHRQTHRVEHGIDCYLSFDLGDVRDLRDLVNDVDLDNRERLVLKTL